MVAPSDCEPPITTPAELAELVAHIRSVGRFAFDTEFVSEQTFEPVLCLVQVATTERLVAIDTIELPDLHPFWDVVTDPLVEVVMHAAGEDLRICRLQTGRVPQRVFDVQIAAGLVGFAYPLSLGNLVSQALKISVFGGETRTDWRKRPLTNSQLRYALDDVRYLLPLADQIRGSLERLGRLAWAEAEFTDFLSEIESRHEADRWKRLSGLHQLNRRGLEVARRLYHWRHEEARRQNRPFRQLLRDDLLVAIAKRQPTTKSDLEALRDFNRPQLLSRSGEILSLIGAALSVPIDELPEPLERHEEGPGLTMVVNLLAAAMANCCAQFRVATGLFGTNSDLKELVRWHVEGRPSDRRPFLASGWRDEVCGEILLDVLAGSRSLRVVDPSADVPVSVERVDKQDPSHDV
ncbi:MAG: ribonuclease D [Isosphaeraceae bacterium]